MPITTKINSFGPGFLIAAAIIGPGTITTASRAGAEFGFTLLWALLFSVTTTMILQDMCVRIGLVSQKPLGEIIREQFNQPLLRFLSSLLIFSAIVIGSAAYEAGNLAGSRMGIDLLINNKTNYSQILVAILIGIFLWFGHYRHFEIFFKACVILMSISFLITAIIIGPSLAEIVKGLFVFQLPTGSMIMTIALIGTTVVPYNLFLHTSLVQQRWKSLKELSPARIDSVIAIAITGLISMAITVTAAKSFPLGTRLAHAQQMGLQLNPILGSWATDCFAVGLTAAGFTSAITAPLAAAYASTGIIILSEHKQLFLFRLTWIFVLTCGTLFSSLNIKPTEIILFAQYANGLLLPLIAIFLLFIMNRKQLLGNYRNKIVSNIAGIIVITICSLLALKSFEFLS